MTPSPDSLLPWLGLCLIAFPALVSRPCPLVTAQTFRARVTSAILSFAGGPTAFMLAGTLGWILLFHLPAGVSPIPGVSVLVLASITGIILLPLSFSTRFPAGLPLLESGARMGLGLACAACWLSTRGGSSHPDILLVGTVAGLLPDALDYWVARVLRRIDIHIVPDPLAPAPGLMAAALAQAVTRCHVEQRPFQLEVYPGRNQAGAWLQYHIEISNPAALVTVTHDGASTSSRLSVPVTGTHPFSLTTGTEPLSLELFPAKDGRVRMVSAFWQSGWSHSLLSALIAGLLAGTAFGYGAGLITVLAWAMHVLLDQSGYGGTAWGFPFVRHHMAGFQLWRPARARVLNLGVLWLGLLVTGLGLSRVALPGITPVNPVALLVVAGITPLAAIRVLSGLKS